MDVSVGTSTAVTHLSPFGQGVTLIDLRDMVSCFTTQSSTVGVLVSDPSVSHGMCSNLAQSLNTFLAYRHTCGFRLTLSWPTTNKDGY